jgi:hypothetical protein
MNFTRELVHRQTDIRRALLWHAGNGPQSWGFRQRGYWQRIDELWKSGGIEGRRRARATCREPHRTTQKYPAGENRHNLLLDRTLPVVEGVLESGSPVVGLRMKFDFTDTFVKFIIPWMELARASNEPFPIRWPFSQLSSTKRMIEVWSVTV